MEDDAMSNEGMDRTLLSFEEQHGKEAETALIGALAPEARKFATIIESKIEERIDSRKPNMGFDAAHLEMYGWGEVGEVEEEDGEEDDEVELQICSKKLHDGEINIGPYSMDQAVAIFGEMVTQLVLLGSKITGVTFSVKCGGWCQYDHPETKSGKKTHERIFIATIVL